MYLQTLNAFSGREFTMAEVLKKKKGSAFDCFSPRMITAWAASVLSVMLLSVVQQDLLKGSEWMKGNAASP